MSGLVDILEQGASLTNSGDYSAAIRTYLGALDMDENNATVWFCLGVLYCQTGSLEEGIQAFERSDEIYPNHPPTLANLAHILVESEPGRARNYAKRALPHLEKDEKLENIASLSNPEETQMPVFVASQPIDDDPIDQIEDIENSFESDEYNRREEARNLSSSGDHSTAVSIWKDLIQQAPDSPEIWRGLGEALSAAGYEDRADQCLKRADRLDSKTDEQTFSELGTDLIQDVDENSELLLRAADEVRSAPVAEERGNLDDALGWYNMGINLLNEGKNDEAISSFEKAIGGSPSSEIGLKVKALNGRGNALYNERRYPESIVAYHAAVELDPKSVSGRTLFNMGSSYAAVEMFEDAIKCFSQSLERGLDKPELELCEKQISRCRVLAREQAKRQSRGVR
tara:strand:+ start:759 stop:1955 length:1197 start_codon:yes stop_codon:yes gene_type:complete